MKNSSGYTFNYHTHCKYCDGHGEMEDYVKEAINRDITIFGFSSHAPVPFETTWTMKKEVLNIYKRTFASLQLKYKNKISLLYGLEVDFIPGFIAPDAAYKKKMGLDYIIGSVHFLGRLMNGEHWTVDGSPEELRLGIEYNFNGDIKSAVKKYYGLLKTMSRECKPDFIGHFDLIKKNNHDNSLFSEDDPWYREIVDDALCTIAKEKSILEVNTGGIVRKRVNSLYPSQWILKKCFELNIPLTLNSDAHNPEEIDGYFDKALEEIKNAGFKKLVYFTKTGKREVFI